MALLEAGQRIATTLDREKLPHTTCAAFMQMCAADAAFLVMNEDDAFHVEGALGLSEEELQVVSTTMLEKVRMALAHVSPLGQALPKDVAPLRFSRRSCCPAIDGEKLLGAVLLLFKQHISMSTGSRRLRFCRGTFRSRCVIWGVSPRWKISRIWTISPTSSTAATSSSCWTRSSRTRRPKAEKPFSLLFLDLDYFKSVNDTHGHVVGSKLLVEVSRVLKACVRDNDVVCRWGGDEYVLLLRGTDSGGALKVAERIRRSIETHRFLAREGFRLQITTCIGIATYPEHAQDKDTLLDFADRAMYRGKKSTRNIIYLAANGLEATPEARHQTTPPKE